MCAWVSWSNRSSFLDFMVLFVVFHWVEWQQTVFSGPDRLLHGWCIRMNRNEPDVNGIEDRRPFNSSVSERVSAILIGIHYREFLMSPERSKRLRAFRPALCAQFIGLERNGTSAGFRWRDPPWSPLCRFPNLGGRFLANCQSLVDPPRSSSRVDQTANPIAGKSVAAAAGVDQSEKPRRPSRFETHTFSENGWSRPVFFSVSRLACLRYLAMVNQFSWSPLPLPPSNERLLGQSSLSSTFKQRPKKNNTVGSFNLFFMNPKLSSKYFFKANSSPFFFLAAWNPLRNGLDKLDVKTSFIVKTESCFGQHSFSKRCSFLFVSRRGIAIHWARSFETIQSSQFKSESKFEKKYFNSIGWLKRWTKTSTGRKMISPDGWFWHNGVSIYAILV